LFTGTYINAIYVPVLFGLVIIFTMNKALACMLQIKARQDRKFSVFTYILR